MQTKLHIKKGDTVIILAGENKGEQGKVLAVDIDSQRAFVEGKNMIAKHAKPDAKNPQGGIVNKEASIHVSNLMIVDPSNGEGTRIGRKTDEKTNKRVRYSKKTGEVI